MHVLFYGTLQFLTTENSAIPPYYEQSCSAVVMNGALVGDASGLIECAALQRDIAYTPLWCGEGFPRATL